MTAEEMAAEAWGACAKYRACSESCRCHYCYTLKLLQDMKQQTLREAAEAMCPSCTRGIPMNSSNTRHIDTLKKEGKACLAYPILAMMEKEDEARNRDTDEG